MLQATFPPMTNARTLRYIQIPLIAIAILIEPLDGQAIKSLTEKLQEIRSTTAPKRKFAFKKAAPQKDPASSNSDYAGNIQAQGKTIRKQNARTASSTIAAPPLESRDIVDTIQNSTIDQETSQSNFHAASIPATSSQPSDTSSSAAVAVSSLESTHYILDSSSVPSASSASLTDLNHSFIDFFTTTGPIKLFAALTIKNVTESLLICESISGAAHISNVRNSTLIISSRQLRLHECKNCVIYLRCSSRPIIEDCTGIKFAPIPPACVDHLSSRLVINYCATDLMFQDPIIHECSHPATANLWDQVDDFKWLRGEQSPNWSVLKAEDERAVEPDVWEVITSHNHPLSNREDLDRLLRTAKVVK